MRKKKRKKKTPANNAYTPICPKRANGVYADRSLQAKKAMPKKIILSCLLFITVISCQAQSRYNLIYEHQLGMNMATENFVAGFHVFDYFDSLYVPKKIITKDNNLDFVINPVYRFGKLFLTNYLLTDFAMTMNHERFGHGYRILEAGSKITEIVYNPPPPFSTDFSYISWDANLNMTPQQELANRFGGSEANLVFSDVLRKNILLDERFSYNYTLAYLYSSNDAPGYAAFVSNPNSDPIQYSQGLNNFYGGSSLTKRKVRTYSLITLLTDPINFYALKSVFYDYLILGKHATQVGMINLSSKIKYLPRFRFENTPYGIELVLQNYMKINKKLIQMNFSHSDGTFFPSWRILANVWNIKKGENVSFSISGQIWQQPEIEFYVNDLLTRSQDLGGQFIIGTNCDIKSYDHLIGVTLHAGYKTKGYSLGEQLNKGIILRGGLTFKLRNQSQ